MSLDFLADDRGVTLTASAPLLLGVFGALTRGVGGSDLIDGVFVAEGRALPVPPPATRGVRGLRVVRLAASVGLRGRLVLRSEDIGPVGLAWPPHLVHSLSTLPWPNNL